MILYIFIKIKYEKEVKKDPSFLFNLDLSENPCLNLNSSKISILRSLIDDTNLFCLDLSHILLGVKPKDLPDSQENSKYRAEVNKLSEDLNKEKEEYEQNLWDKKCYQIDKQEVLERLDEWKKEDLKSSEKYDESTRVNLINAIDEKELEDENAKYPLFLRENIKKLITKIVQYSGNECDEFKETIKQKLILRNKNKIERKEGEKIKIEDSDTVNIEEYKKMEKFLLYNMQLRIYERELSSKENLKLDRKLIII